MPNGFDSLCVWLGPVGCSLTLYVLSLDGSLLLLGYPEGKDSIFLHLVTREMRNL